MPFVKFKTLFTFKLLVFPSTGNLLNGKYFKRKGRSAKMQSALALD